MFRKVLRTRKNITETIDELLYNHIPGAIAVYARYDGSAVGLLIDIHCFASAKPGPPNQALYVR